MVSGHDGQCYTRDVNLVQMFVQTAYSPCDWT